MQQQAVMLDGPRRLRLGESAVRDPGPGELRVRVVHAGICGSDLHVYETGAYVPRFPITPGHEVSGIVEALGIGVDDIVVGTPVVLDSRVPCRACDWCARGEPQCCRGLGFLGEVCNGGFAASTVVPRTMAFAVPVGLPLDVAALAEPCAVALHGARRALAACPGAQSARIVGVGPLGALSGLVLRERGLSVTGVEANARRREAAAAALPFPIVAPDDSTETDQVADLVVDTAGYAGSLHACMTGVRAGGVVLALALHRLPETLPANEVVERELTLLGAHVFRDEMDDALALLSRRAGIFAPLITTKVPLEGVADAYHDLIAGSSGHLKVLVTPACA